MRSNKKILILGSIIILLIIICLTIMLFKKTNDKNKDLYNKYIKEGYKEINFSNELKPIYRDITNDLKNATLLIKNDDEEVVVTIKYDESAKKLYYESSLLPDRTYINVDDVVDYLYIIQGSSPGHSHLFILSENGELYHKLTGYYNSYQEFIDDISIIEKINVENKYQNIGVNLYGLDPMDYHDWILYGTSKDNEFTAILTKGEVDEIKVLEEKYDHTYYGYIYRSVIENNSYFTIMLDGTINIFKNDKPTTAEIKTKNIIVRTKDYYDDIDIEDKDNKMYFIGNDNRLYTIDIDNNVKKINENKVYKVLKKEHEENKVTIKIILENAKEIEIESYKNFIIDYE